MLITDLYSFKHSDNRTSQVLTYFYPEHNLQLASNNDNGTFLHCTLAAAQCIVIGPVCLWLGGCVCVCGWVCYHDNSKLHASILTKLSLWIKVLTISNWLNFGRPAPPGRGSAAGRKFLAPPYYKRAVFASLWALLIFTRATLYIARSLPSCGVRPSVRHMPVLYLNGRTDF